MPNEITKIQPIVSFDEEYRQWILQLCQRYHQSQVKAAVKVNEEMLHFYWSVGRDISERKYANRYGTKFYANASRDIQKELGITQGLSERSLRYTASMYDLYSPLFKDVDTILRQPAAEFQNRQQLVDESCECRNLRQVAAEFNLLFLIPWTHHQKIIDKVDGNAEKAFFFVRKSLQNQWGRALLVNALSSDLYERQQSAQTNFDIALPSPESDLAKEYFHTPYNFEFTGLMERHKPSSIINHQSFITNH